MFWIHARCLIYLFTCYSICIVLTYKLGTVRCIGLCRRYFTSWIDVACSQIVEDCGALPIHIFLTQQLQASVQQHQQHISQSTNRYNPCTVTVEYHEVLYPRKLFILLFLPLRHHHLPTYPPPPAPWITLNNQLPKHLFYYPPLVGYGQPEHEHPTWLLCGIPLYNRLVENTVPCTIIPKVSFY